MATNRQQAELIADSSRLAVIRCIMHNTSFSKNE